MNTKRDWKKELRKFQKFLESIDLQKYSYLRQIKTVEQDLPKELLPLEIYYRYYWVSTDFKDYDEVFEIYWEEKLHYIFGFIKKYFYGCSLAFVEEGFKARLYRIWVSVLTQFHFQYLWNSLFEEKIQSNPDLDKLGIDGIIEVKSMKVGFQIKKISFRYEVLDRKFTKRQMKSVDVLIEIPYLIINEKLVRSSELESVLSRYFRKLKNGFVVFSQDYAYMVNNVVRKIRPEDKGIKISYDRFINVEKFRKPKR